MPRTSRPKLTAGLSSLRWERCWDGRKMHWVTEGSHCNDDYPDKECPQSRGLRRLNATDLLLYNLDVSPGETRNLSVAAFPDVVAKLTALKLAHEAEPDIFGRSEIHRGGDARLEPCPPEAVARGCVPQPGPPPSHANPSGSGPWPQLSNMTMLVQTLPDGDPYRRFSCDTTKAAAACGVGPGFRGVKTKTHRCSGNLTFSDVSGG